MSNIKKNHTDERNSERKRSEIFSSTQVPKWAHRTRGPYKLLTYLLNLLSWCKDKYGNGDRVLDIHESRV